MEQPPSDSPLPFTPVDGASKRVKLMPWVLAEQERTARLEKPVPGSKRQRRRQIVSTSTEARPT